MTCTRIPENEIDASTIELIRVSRVTTWAISCGRGNRWGGYEATVGTLSRWVMENDMRTKAMKPRRQLDNGFDQRVTRDRVAEFTETFKQDNAAAGHAVTRDTLVTRTIRLAAGFVCWLERCFPSVDDLDVPTVRLVRRDIVDVRANFATQPRSTRRSFPYSTDGRILW
jgi:hypothetical protein